PIQALKNVLSALWNGMKAAAIKIWTLLKNGVLAIIRAYVAQVRSNFNLVKRIVLTIFNAIKSFSIRVWNAIKNGIDRKSTRLNSSHVSISYAVFCLKKKKKKH